MRDTVKNASGDLFEIWRRDGRWYAAQITGLSKCWLNIGALIHADSRADLIREVKAHTFA